MLNDIFKYMLISLCLTIIIEVTISLILKVRNKKDILLIVLVNLMTNPLVVSISFITNILHGLKMYYIVIVILEILAILIEGLVYKKYLNYKKINPFVLSLILNLISYLSGFIVY